jgi:hypothetical protein
MVSRSGSIAVRGRSDWLRRVGGGLVMAAGLGVLVFAALNLIQDGSLWILGQRAEAQVVGVWIEEETEARAEAPTFRWFIRYQFSTPGGQVVTGVSRISANEWAAIGHSEPVEVAYEGEDTGDRGFGAVEDGSWVGVTYLPGYPAHNRLDESRFVPVLACAYLPLILLGGAGLAAGRGLLQRT